MMFVPQEFIDAEVAYRRRRGAEHVAGAALRSHERMPRTERARTSRIGFHLQGRRRPSIQ